MNQPRGEDRPDVGRIAHDLNNLLTSIRGLSTLILRDLEPDHPLRRDVEEIERAAQNAVRLTRELHASSAAPANLETRHLDSTTGDETVLVADDDAAIRRLVARVLEQAGYRVLAAADVEEALALAQLEAGRITLLLTDVEMPGVGGAELARQVLDRWPGVRVVYMSGYTENPVVRRAAQNSDDAYLAKPFSPDTLLATVRQTLDRNHNDSR